MKNIIHSILITTMLLSGCNKNKNVKQEFYPSGQLKHEVGIMNGLRHGTETEYYEDGSIKMRGTRVDDIESGSYYFYNVNQQLDSIIELIPINIDEPLLSFLDKNNEYDKNGIAINRRTIYKNGKIDYEKSVYFHVVLEKDTVLLGDTIFILIDFVNQSKNQQNPFKVYLEKEDEMLASHPEENEQVVYFHFIPKKRGLQTFKGFIVEDFPIDDITLWLFEHQYYVE